VPIDGFLDVAVVLRVSKVVLMASLLQLLLRLPGRRRGLTRYRGRRVVVRRRGAARDSPSAAAPCRCWS